MTFLRKHTAHGILNTANKDASFIESRQASVAVLGTQALSSTALTDPGLEQDWAWLRTTVFKNQEVDGELAIGKAIVEQGR